MQNKAWRVVSIISLLVVVGCSHSNWPSVSSSESVNVENVDAQLVDDGRTIELEASGFHDSCLFIFGYDVSVEDAGQKSHGNIAVQLRGWRPDSDVACTPLGQPFDFTISIDMSEFSLGQYNVDVNGVSTTITLPTN